MGFPYPLIDAVSDRESEVLSTIMMVGGKTSFLTAKAEVSWTWRNPKNLDDNWHNYMDTKVLGYLRSSERTRAVRRNLRSKHLWASSLTKLLLLAVAFEHRTLCQLLLVVSSSKRCLRTSSDACHSVLLLPPSLHKLFLSIDVRVECEELY